MKWKLLIGVALSAAFLYLAFRGSDFHEIGRALRTANYLWLIPTVVATMGSLAIRALRWRFLLLGVGRLPFASLWASTMIGFMGNNVLPARLGELLRVHSIGRSASISRSAALGSIIIERILDMSILLLLFTTVLLAGRLPEEVRGWSRYLLAAGIPVLVGVVVFHVGSNFFLGLIERFAPERLRERLLHAAGNFRDGLAILGHWRELLLALALSLVMWFCLVGVIVFCFLSLDLDLPPDAGVVVLVIMAIGTMLPSAPGFIGTLQYAGKLALVQYGVDPSVALSFTLIYHISQWVPITAVGLFYFMQQHLSLKQIGETGDLPQPAKKPMLDADGAGPRGNSE